MLTIDNVYVFGYEARVRFGTRVRVWAGLGNFFKSRVRVWRDSAIKKLLKIFLFIFSIYFYY